MATIAWVTDREFECEHIGQRVRIESELVFPADHLPEQPPRRRARRCSHHLECNLRDTPSCVWAGTHPLYNPLDD